MKKLEEAIKNLFKDWRQNTEGNEGVLNSVEYRVLLKVEAFEKANVVVPLKEYEEAKQHLEDASFTAYSNIKADEKTLYGQAGIVVYLSEVKATLKQLLGDGSKEGKEQR